MISHGVKIMLKSVNRHCVYLILTIMLRPAGSSKRGARRTLARPLMPALCLLWLLTEVSIAAPKWANTPQARTFVSGLGNDTDPCTAQQPCRTLGAALALTTAGGE